MTDHPAQYSKSIIDALRPLLLSGMAVHDPFGGAGVRLGALCDEVGCEFTGTEIEPEFITDPRVRQGDSTDPDSYPEHDYMIVTSPVYPNGMADDFDARDGSKRRTYRAALAKLIGKDRPLHPNNQGRWGYRGTPAWSAQRAVYWKLAREVVACWDGADSAIVNVSDFLSGDHREPVVNGWHNVLMAHGWDVIEEPVETPRFRHGANRGRVESEVLLLCSREPMLGWVDESPDAGYDDDDYDPDDDDPDPELQESGADPREWMG